VDGYTHALGKAIAEHYQTLVDEGKHPVGLRLMPSEVTTVRGYIEATVGSESFLQPVGGGLSSPQILGMAIIEVRRPIPLAERFMLDDEGPKRRR
jgi:hypothetical protein